MNYETFIKHFAEYFKDREPVICFHGEYHDGEGFSGRFYVDLFNHHGVAIHRYYFDKEGHMLAHEPI